MPDIYVPGVRQDWAGRYGWSYAGGPSKVVLHSTESASYPGCVHDLAVYLDGWANPHLVWDPWSGDMAMTGRADWAEGALLAGNRDGQVVLQVEAVGRAQTGLGQRPFADSPMKGWSEILGWFDSWGVPRVFPAGIPLPYPAAYGYDNGHRPLAVWNNDNGYYGHSNVPQNDHGDPGTVRLDLIFPGGHQQEDEVSVLPVITGADHTHPKSLALAKDLLTRVNPHVDLTTDAKSLQAFEQFKAFFKVTGDKPGTIGVNTWRTLLKVGTGGGK